MKHVTRSPANDSASANADMDGLIPVDINNGAKIYHGTICTFAHTDPNTNKQIWISAKINNADKEYYYVNVHKADRHYFPQCGLDNKPKWLNLQIAKDQITFFERPRSWNTKDFEAHFQKKSEG